MGHGSHTPENGMFNVPKGFSVHLYAEHAKQLNVADLIPILWNDPAARQPDRIINEFRNCPNLTWVNGAPNRWKHFVEDGNATHQPPNAHLQSHQQFLTWDVCYVQQFKTGLTLTQFNALPTPRPADVQGQLSTTFTLKDLLDPPHAYFDGKQGPFEIHVLLCAVVLMKATPVGRAIGINALRSGDGYLHSWKGPGATFPDGSPVTAPVRSRSVLGETSRVNIQDADRAGFIARGNVDIPLSDYARQLEIGILPDEPDWAVARNSCSECWQHYGDNDKFCRNCGHPRYSG
jgi:hypothetical protein